MWLLCPFVRIDICWTECKSAVWWSIDRLDVMIKSPCIRRVRNDDGRKKKRPDASDVGADSSLRGGRRPNASRQHEAPALVVWP